MAKTITLNAPPAFYIEYTKNWLAQKKKEGAPKQEIAIVEDISKLIGVAAGILEPKQNKPETIGKQ